MVDNDVKSEENSTSFNIKYLHGEDSNEDDTKLKEIKESESPFDVFFNIVGRYAKFGKDAAKVVSAFKEGVPEGTITNELFYQRNPDVKRGERLKPNQKELIKIWLKIRNDIVRPIYADLKNKVKEPTTTYPNQSSDKNPEYAPEPMKVPPENPVEFAPEPNGIAYWPVIDNNDKDWHVVSYQFGPGKNDFVRGRNTNREFAAPRGEGRTHPGCDMYTGCHAKVVAIQDGIFLYAIKNFLGDTSAMYIQHTIEQPNIIVLYGEIAYESWKTYGLKIGDKVKAGQVIAEIGTTPKGTCMLHLETWDCGLTDPAIKNRLHSSFRSWKKGGNPPKYLLNPTKYLLAIRKQELARRQQNNYSEQSDAFIFNESNIFDESESPFDVFFNIVGRYAKFGKDAAKVVSAFKEGVPEGTITNELFYQRNPDVKRGERLKPNQKELIKIWLKIRNDIVRPIYADLKKIYQTKSVPSGRQADGIPINLPDVLAGPMVRRAAKDSIWFWIALCEKITDVSANIFRYNNQGQILNEIPVHTPVVKILQLGKNLWIALAKVVPSSANSFPTDTILGYDLNLVTEGYNTSRSRKLSELPISAELNYPPFKHPTLLIGEKNTTIAHGSCRRPYYGFEAYPDSMRDAFGAFDKWLSEKIGDLHARPASIILTGDQIYADDQPCEMLHAIQNIAKDVFGYDELINVGTRVLPKPPYFFTNLREHTSDYFKPSKNISCIPGNNKFSDRRYLTHYSTSSIGFTTDDGEAHLLSLPEYASMYLLVWCPELWDQYCNKDNEIRKTFEKNYKSLVDYNKDINCCRRVLANSAVYMIKDDHDRTDDDQLDALFAETTKNDPTAQQILSNADIAYFAFQAWGNDPDMFDDNFVKSISNYLTGLLTNNGMPPKNAKDLYLSLLNKQWSFVTASNPKALCIDIRNGRDYPAILGEPNREDKRYATSENFKNQLLARLKKQVIDSVPNPIDTAGRIIDVVKDTIPNPIDTAGRIIDVVKDTIPNPIDIVSDTFALSQAAEKKSAILVGKRARATLESFANRFTEGDVLLVVLPTPFFGHPFHIIAQDILFKFPDLRYQGDWELFDNNTKQRPEFICWLKKIFKPSAVVIFSGDVHYGSVVCGGYAYSKTITDAKLGNFLWTLSVCNVTSSGIKNGKDILWDIVEGKMNAMAVELLAGVEGKMNAMAVELLARKMKLMAVELLAPMTKVRVSTDQDKNLMLMGTRVTKLSGTLSNNTIVHQNNICVVTMPNSENNEVTSTFIGEKNKILSTSKTSINLKNKDFLKLIHQHL